MHKQWIFAIAALSAIACSGKGVTTCQSSYSCKPGELCLGRECTPAQGRVVSVAVTGWPLSVIVGATISFSATVSGVAEQRVTWDADYQAGSIDASGVFTAERAGAWHVRATSVADISKSATVMIEVPAVTLGAIAPADPVVPFEKSQQLSAAVGNAVDQSVRWSVVEPDGGTISASGVYQPPDTADTPAVFHVQAVSVADQAQISTTTVTLPRVKISPPAAIVTLGAPQQFSASVTDVLWGLEGLTPTQNNLGSLSASGLYVAPPYGVTPTSVHVVARSRHDPLHPAVATVNIPEVGISASPASVSLRFGQRLQFSATVANASDTSVGWRISSYSNLDNQDPEGFIDAATGVYDAPAGGVERMSVQITAYSVADQSKSAVAQISLSFMPAIETFSAGPQVARPGQPITLSWQAVGADSLRIDPDIGDVTGKASVQVTPSSTTGYRLTAVNSAGTATATTLATISPGVPIINGFSASGGRALPGRPIALNWAVSGADSVHVEPGIGAVAATGSAAVTPTTDTTYTLSAVNAQGQSTSTALVRAARFRLTGAPRYRRMTNFSTCFDDFCAEYSQSKIIEPLPDGTSILLGGLDWIFENNQLVNVEGASAAEIFDPSANGGNGGFVRSVPMAPEAWPIALVRLQSGKILVGGANLQLYDPAAGAFQNLGPNPSGDGTGSGVLLSDGRAAIFGTHNGTVYDPSTGSFGIGMWGWANAGIGEPIPLPSGKFLLTGDTYGAYQVIYDPSLDAAHAITPSATSFYISVGTVGGFENAIPLPNGKVFLNLGTEIFTYDPATGTVGGVIKLPFDCGTGSEPAVLLGNGEILLPVSCMSPPFFKSFLYDSDANGGAGALYQGPTRYFDHPGGFAGTLSDGSVLFAAGCTEWAHCSALPLQAEIFEWK